ncbi:MAG: hypothetical protein ACRESS_00320 [Stenotrophobium sp.]
MNSDAQPLQSWLDHQPRNVRELLTRAQRLAEIDRAVHEYWTQEPWAETLRIANIRGNTVVIFTPTAAALIPLRYHQKALLGFLKHRFQLACTAIEVKVSPHT